MNRYGEQAMTHWKEHKPQAFGELEIPEEFFTGLGEEISAEIETRARELAGPEPDGEGYLQRLQRLSTSRLTAEGEVLRERVLLDVEPDQE
ncbi:hypothetical protein [Streptomyces canus]|uniref:hypothetical protein n=1 Tax=Streptomyces canus TaxID=58343 RepID=UPI00278355F8|nr:hypothetical protein [Streptomyces canus]MDQ0765618.1 hypothetical protein [Streptomyces canus]